MSRDPEQEELLSDTECAPEREGGRYKKGVQKASHQAASRQELSAKGDRRVQESSRRVRLSH